MEETPVPAAPVAPLAPVIHTGLLSSTPPLVRVVTVLLHMYFPLTQAGAVVDQLPPVMEVELVER